MKSVVRLTQLHSGRPKLYAILVFLSAVGLILIQAWNLVVQSYKEKSLPICAQLLLHIYKSSLTVMLRVLYFCRSNCFLRYILCVYKV